MNSKDKNPSTEEEKAFERLKKFMAHGSVLERIEAAVGKDENESNVEIAHEILGPLCGNIVLNSHHKNELKKKQEACGANPCNHIQLPEDKNWGGLYLGSNKTWYGEADMLVLPVYDSDSDSAVAVSKADEDSEEDNSEEGDESEDQPGTRIMVEGKTKGRQNNFSPSIATAITFASVQHMKYPDLPRVFIPTIQVSPDLLVILLYNPQNDQLIGRSYKWGDMSIIILWVVMHYRLFSASVVKGGLPSNFKHLVLGEPFQNWHYLTGLSPYLKKPVSGGGLDTPVFLPGVETVK